MAKTARGVRVQKTLRCPRIHGPSLAQTPRAWGREFVEDLDTAVMMLLERYKIGLLAAKPVLPI